MDNNQEATSSKFPLSFSRLKRKCRDSDLPPTFMRDGKEVEDTLTKYLILFQNGSYDVVGDREIYLDASDEKRAHVFHMSKKYVVHVLYSGDEEYIGGKARKCGFNVSLKTSDEEEANEQIKIMEEEIKNAQKLAVQAREKFKRDYSQLYTTGVSEDEDLMDSMEPSPKKKTQSNHKPLSKPTSKLVPILRNKPYASSLVTFPARIDSSIATQASREAIQATRVVIQASGADLPARSKIVSHKQIDIGIEPSGLNDQSSQLITNHNRTITSYNTTRAESALPTVDTEFFQTAIQELREKVQALQAQRPENQNSHTNRFVIIGVDGTSKDMIDEIFGRNFIKWMLAVCKHYFSERELMESTLEPSTRTTRTHLDPVKVLLMREALSYKYKFTPEKLDKAWSAVRQAINNKGRNLKLKHRARTLLARTVNAANVVGNVVRSLSGISLAATE